MIRAVFAWLTPTAFFEPTGAELAQVLRRIGYVGAGPMVGFNRPSAGFQRVYNEGVRIRAAQALHAKSGPAIP